MPDQSDNWLLIRNPRDMRKLLCRLDARRAILEIRQAGEIHRIDLQRYGLLYHEAAPLPPQQRKDDDHNGTRTVEPD